MVHVDDYHSCRGGHYIASVGAIHYPHEGPVQVGVMVPQHYSSMQGDQIHLPNHLQDEDGENVGCMHKVPIAIAQPIHNY